jgi:glycosyltransferase involved in cell wall biosynthesis
VNLMIIDTSPVNSGGAQLLFRYAKYFDPARVRPTMALHEDNLWAERYRAAGTADVLVEPRMPPSSPVPPFHATPLPQWLAQASMFLGRVIAPSRRLLAEIEPRRIDVVLGLCDKSACIAAVLGTLTGRPAVMHLVSTYVNPFEPAVLTAFGLLPAVHRVVVLSRFSASQLPLLARKTTTIYSGIDLDDFAAPHPGGALRTAYGIPADAPLVGIAGRFVEIKGMDVFARAAARVAVREPRARFFMLGDHRGPYGDSVRALVRELGLEERVTFTGFVDDMHAAMADLDVVVVPSRRECAPLVVYEAMALGKPVVASDVHGLPELVERGRTGLLVPVEDDAAAAAAIVALLEDPARRRAMGEAAQRRIREQFNVRHATRALEDVVCAAAPKIA